MEKEKTTLLLSMALLTILLITTITEADPDTTIVDVICNTLKWKANDPYGQNVANTLDELAIDAPREVNYTTYTEGQYGGTSVYGYASCRLSLSTDECYDCVAEAATKVYAMCAFAVGAEIELADCRVRYENFPFYG